MNSGGRTRWWLVFALCAGLILAVSFLFDAAVQRWVAESQVRSVRSLMEYASDIGDWPGLVVAALAGALVAQLRRNRRWVRICVAMIVACAVAGALTRVVKIAAGRARPSVEIDAGFNGPRFTAKYHAFPSGHTASSAAFFGVLAFVNGRIFAALLPIPLLIAFSRIYLGAHHFSDVIGGMLVGGVVAVLVAAGWHRFAVIERGRV